MKISQAGINRANHIRSRIIGGIDTYIDKYPYQVSIRSYGQEHCGGAIISEWYILTAAHCIGNILVHPFDNVTIHTGTDNIDVEGNLHRMANIVGHPEYNPDQQHHNDIAVIKLVEPIIFDDYQRVINLPSKDVEINKVAVVTGWGYTSVEDKILPAQLQMAEMITILNSECQKQLSIFIFDEQICALQKDGVGTCMGDSGGPLVVDDQLVGITSWGVPCGKGYPDVYTKVYAYLDFIKSVMQESNQNNKENK